MRSRSPWPILALSLTALACGASGVSFSGQRGPRVAEVAQLEAGDQPPPGLERRGRLAAACTLVDARDGLDGERLSDVGCSPALLRAALREAAVGAGGSWLGSERCEPPGEARVGRRVECSAEVYGPRDPSRFVAPAVEAPLNVDPRGPAAPLTPAYGSVHQAWDIELDYSPAPGAPRRAPLAPGQVSEIDFPRVGHVRLGDVRARGDADCAPETLRGALWAAAARVGASSVVGVRCVDEGDARECVASLAAPEVEEGAEARVKGP